MLKRTLLVLFLVASLFVLAAEAEAAWNVCQTQLNCAGSYNDLTCYGQCEANACSEAWSTDWWYQILYDQCFTQMNICAAQGGSFEWCKSSVLDPCVAPIADDHRDSCDDIQNRKSSCQAGCWECSYC